MRSRGTALLVVALGALAISTPGPAAQAEVVTKGDLTVAFHGSISPIRLPRDGAAPISVQMGGKIKGAQGGEPPVLERISLEINREGVLQSKGLARCPLAKLRSSSSATARRICAGALVGRGNVTSRITLPEQGAFASNGPLLAFNGVQGGKPAIFAQVATAAPLPLTYVIVFEVRKGPGRFGTRLTATLPEIASSYGHISAFDMSLSRRYTYRGQRLSFVSAGCPAASGFRGAVFPLARVGYEFADGREVTSTLVRQCKVSGR